MDNTIWQQGLHTILFNGQTLIMVMMVLLHIVCALAISRDLGHLAKRKILPQLLPSAGWVLAGLIVGIWAVLIYWLMHHSSLSRQ